MPFVQVKSMRLLRSSRNLYDGPGGVEKNQRFAASMATYPQQLSKTLPSKHILNPELSK
jgi:hypothetical protein